jgi:hypothetical protein
MGMNRKWNMKVFELHDANGESEPAPIAPQNDDVYIDTSSSDIIMSKYPFTAEGMLPLDADPSTVLEINLSDLTQDPDFLEYITDVTNWHFRQGDTTKMQFDTEDGTKIAFKSIVQAFLDLPTESEKWVLKFNLHTNPTFYRSFFYFDGIEDETQTTVRYEYGMDIPKQGYPHLEEITDYNTFAAEKVEQTIADEQYFTGEYDMPVIVTRWNNTYTLYYDNRYMITIPTDSDTLNRIGFWTWSGSNMYINNPELYIIDSDSDATNIIINTNTNPESNDDIDVTEYEFSLYENESDETPTETGIFTIRSISNSVYSIMINSSTQSNMVDDIYYLLDFVDDGLTKAPLYAEAFSSTPSAYITYKPYNNEQAVVSL